MSREQACQTPRYWITTSEADIWIAAAITEPPRSVLALIWAMPLGAASTPDHVTDPPARLIAAFLHVPPIAITVGRSTEAGESTDPPAMLTVLGATIVSPTRSGAVSSMMTLPCTKCTPGAAPLPS